MPEQKDLAHMFFLKKDILIKFRCLHAGLEDVDTDAEKQYFFDAR